MEELRQAVARGDEFAAVDLAHRTWAGGVDEETLPLDLVAAVQLRVDRGPPDGGTGTHGDRRQRTGDHLR